MRHALVWFRRDLRLADNAALQAALEAGYAPVPVFVHAPEEETPWAPGPASQAWLRRSLSALAGDLETRGARLLLRAGPSAEALERLVGETGADAIFCNRLYEPAAMARDAAVAAGLHARGVAFVACSGALLVEPASLVSSAGEPYRMFTPFWRKARHRLAVAPTLPAPASLPAVPLALASLALAELPLPAGDATAHYWQHWQPGEDGARELLDAFLEGVAHAYGSQRDLPDRAGSSRLSPHLHFGELTPRQLLARLGAQHWPEAARPHVDRYIDELGWREFAHYLLFHNPASTDRDLNPRFAAFPWAPADPVALECWQQGRTGVPLVDAGMRELLATGWMHNRARMVVASFLTKNLRFHWLHGARWFWQRLLDADLANNTLGWQWSAGTGVDASPYFRIFSPIAQAERFDPKGSYIRRWVPELAGLPAPALFAPWRQPELARRLAPDYPAEPIVDLQASRLAALDAYQSSKP